MISIFYSPVAQNMFVIVFLVAKRLYIWSKSHCIAFGTFLPSGVKSKETKQNLFSSCFVTADADFDYVSSDDEYTSSSSEEVTYVQEVVVQVSTSKML